MTVLPQAPISYPPASSILSTSKRPISNIDTAPADLCPPVDRATPLPLAHEWCLYIDVGAIINASAEDYEAALSKHATVGTVQSFWQVYNNIQSPSTMPNRHSMHFMKNHVKPLWEDPANLLGGAWTFRTAKKDTQAVWRDVLLMLIGEQFDDCIAKGDEILGFTVSSRASSDILQLWSARADLHNAELKERIRQAFPSVNWLAVYYKPHKEHQAFLNPA